MSSRVWRKKKQPHASCCSNDIKVSFVDAVTLTIAICVMFVIICRNTDILGYFRREPDLSSQPMGTGGGAHQRDDGDLQKSGRTSAEPPVHSSHHLTNPGQRFTPHTEDTENTPMDISQGGGHRSFRHDMPIRVVSSTKREVARHNRQSHISHGGPYIHFSHTQDGGALQATLRGRGHAPIHNTGRGSYIADTNTGHTNNSETFEPIRNYTSEEIQAGLSTETTAWFNAIVPKLTCMRSGKAGSASIFLYHVRKAAGTTLREVFQHYSRKHRIQFHETEGLILEHKFFDTPNLISCITFRNPVERVVSLYWYEHVAWYYTITKEKEKTKPIRVWVDAWRDGAKWKTEFIRKNPRTNYVEIENYYIKALLGYQLDRKVNEKDLEVAKEVVARFDVVLISEWLSDEGQLTFLNEFFGGRMNIALPNTLKGDIKLKREASKHLVNDYENVIKDITEMNALDMQLYEYIKTLVAERILLTAKMVESVNKRKPDRACRPHIIDKDLSKLLGFHRPPGHKGPIDSLK